MRVWLRNMLWAACFILAAEIVKAEMEGGVLEFVVFVSLYATGLNFLFEALKAAMDKEKW